MQVIQYDGNHTELSVRMQVQNTGGPTVGRRCFAILKASYSPKALPHIRAGAVGGLSEYGVLFLRRGLP